MTHTGRILQLTLLIVSLLAFSVSAISQEREAVSKATHVSLVETLITLRAAPEPFDFHVAPPASFYRLRVQTATINVNFIPGGTSLMGYDCYTWPADARTAFNYAASIWESLIESDVPMEIAACWTSFADPYILGASGTIDFYRNFPGAPQPNTDYPVSLTNALTGLDANDTDSLDTDGDGHDADPETYILYNRNTDWYYGTDGNVPSGKWDFTSVVLHEIAHSLGFAGSMDRGENCGGDDLGCWSGPFVYDRFTERGGGTTLLSRPNPSFVLGNDLISDDVFFDGPNANAANGGSQPELYAPNEWRSGSSYSHLAESYNGTQNALMTYSLAPGESEHSPGPVALGMLKDIGWTLVDMEPDLTIQKRAWPPDAQPGDAITFTLSIENAGDEAATNVLVTDTIPSGISGTSYDSSLSISVNLSEPDYVWSLPDLEPGDSGVITVTGTIDAPQSTGWVIVNRATIGTSDEESSTSNNTSAAILGGYDVFLPLTLRGSS